MTTSRAIFHDGRAFSLPVVSPEAQEPAEVAVQRLAEAMGMGDADIGYVGSLGELQFWRADVPGGSAQPALTLAGLRWRSTADVQLRDTWRRAHFDALRFFGVLPLGESGCKGVKAGVTSLAALASSSPSASLLPELLVAQASDPFLQQVEEGIKGSNHGEWRDFSRNEAGFICYQRDGDAISRICVPKVSRDAVLHAAHGGALVGHPGITRTSVNVAQFFGGQIFFATLLTSCGVAVHVLQLKALRVYGWESIFPPAFLYSRLLTGAWTSLVLCLSRAVATT
jgi:hypothetical protein